MCLKNQQAMLEIVQMKQKLLRLFDKLYWLRHLVLLMPQWG